MWGIWQTPRPLRTGDGNLEGRGWPLRCLALALLLGGPGATADEPEALRLPPELSSWEHWVNVRVRGGYDDNVLLSSFSPEGSAFLGGGLEAMVWRTIGERTTVEAFVNGDYRQFLTAANVHNEADAFGLVQVKHDWPDAWRVTGAFEYLYQDQILDVSATEPTLEVVAVQGHTFIVRPTVRRQLGGGWVELELPAEGQLFHSPLDDTRQVAPRLTGGLPLGGRDDLTLSYAYAHTWYETEPDRAADGTAVPGTRRQMTDQDVRLGWKHVWDEARRWQTTARVSGRWTADHASGYYDYTRAQAFLQVRYRSREWEFSGDARFTHFHYPVQTVSATDPAHRLRSEITGNLAAERALTPWLKLFVDYTFDRTYGNRPEDEYTVNTVSAGLNFEF